MMLFKHVQERVFKLPKTTIQSKSHSALIYDHMTVKLKSCAVTGNALVRYDMSPVLEVNFKNCRLAVKLMCIA